MVLLDMIVDRLQITVLLWPISLESLVLLSQRGEGVGTLASQTSPLSL